MRRPKRHKRNAAPTLPPELIQQVLLWLPVGELCQSRCVSRQWQSLISEPAFIKSHRLRSKPNPQVIFLKQKRDDKGLRRVHFISRNVKWGGFVSEFSYIPPPSFRTDLAMLYSCRELVLISDFEHVFLSNPASHEVLDLTESCRNFLGDTIALGYVPSTMEYKVVDLNPFFEGKYHKKTKDVFWVNFRVIDVSINGVIGPEASYDIEFRNECRYKNLVSIKYPVCANGFMYGILWDDDVDDPVATILSFDLRTHNVHIIPNLPGHSDPRCLILKDSACGNSIYAGFYFHADQVMELWLLKYSSEWEKKYTIDFSTLYISMPSSNNNEVPVAIVFLDVESAEILFKVDHEYFVFYDMEYKFFRHVEDLDEMGMLYKSCAYHEGFFPLRG